jgi:hypothetical protein
MNRHRKQIESRAIVTAALALAFLALGCGKQEERAASSPGGASSAGISETTPTAAQASQVMAASTSAGAGETGTQTDGRTVAAPDSLPPDVAATAPEGLVIPGSVVEILAQGSPDVTAITLTDGIGQRKAFVYDPQENLWIASYRVPLRGGSDRLALSVTATNNVNRWKRVWVFVKVLRGEKEAVAEPDSGSQ